MARRNKRAKRCPVCRVHEGQCVCEQLPKIALETRLELVMHHREETKTTATGPLALACLANSNLHLHGLRDQPLDLTHLHDEGRRVMVLFPSEGAAPLGRALVEQDPRPVTLVVPDGNWRQAHRIPNRVPGLPQAERVTLPPGPTSRWGVRTETQPGGLATFEAIARALGVLESRQVQDRMETFFAKLADTTLAARGYDRVTATSASKAEPLPIVFQDQHLVAINKPAGMPAHRGWAQDGVPALQCLRDQLGQQVFPVHRLDRATSGVLLFALSSEVARDMQTNFANAGTTKRYLALCRGHDAALARVDHALAKEAGAEKRPAVTDFRLLGQFERYGLFEALPRSGRTHQIRRHLKHASHPIIGDVRYGKGEHNRIFRERFGFRRMALHCHQMSFEHPRGRGHMVIEAPLGQELNRLFDGLGLLAAI